MSDSPLKSSNNPKVTIRMIDEIASFSSINMFSHLFELTHVVAPLTTQIESQCQQILRNQLQPDLLPQVSETERGEELIRNSTLEELLSTVFNASSDFWEVFYRRINRRNHSINTIPIPWDSANSDIQDIVRTRYPHFYIPLDVMMHVNKKSSEEYQLIQLSLQALLKGLIFRARGHHDDMREAFSQALKLTGPLHVPDYRKMLICLLEI